MSNRVLCHSGCSCYDDCRYSRYEGISPGHLSASLLSSSDLWPVTSG